MTAAAVLLFAWLFIAVGAALLIGGAIHIADQQQDAELRRRTAPLEEAVR